jgi:phage tail sheath protein FI
MPEYKAPGVYVEEVPSSVKPIAGVSTSTAGFVGVTQRGPTEPLLVTSWPQFENLYGGFVPDRSYLAYAVKGFFDNGGRRCHVARVAGGGVRDATNSLDALPAIDEIALLLAPDHVHPRFNDGEQQAITEAVVRQCEERQNRFALLSVPQGQRDFAQVHPAIDTSYGAFYYPWVVVGEPGSGAERPIPATGHIAGIYARTDMERGVHKAPANVALRGVVDLEFAVTEIMLGTLTPRGVNCLRDFRELGRGIRVWGARTISSDPEWKYVSVRRLALYINEAIIQGTQWVVFEPNDEALWARVQSSVGTFLFDLWRTGALQGTRPEEAFFVRCDRTTMTQNDIANGRLVCLVGFAPLRPAEFVILSIRQATAGTSI